MSPSNPSKGEKRPGKRSIPESIHDQRKRLLNHDGSGAGRSLVRLEYGTNRENQPTLHAVFANSVWGSPIKDDLTFLLEFPNLWEMFSEGYLRWGALLSTGTRKGTAYFLKRDFFHFLSSAYHENLMPDEIDDQVLTAFYWYLHSPRRNGEPLTPARVCDSLGAVRRVLGSLDTGRWAAIATSIAERVPSGPVGSGSSSEAVPVLSRDHMVAIVKGAEKELLELNDRWEKGKKLIAEGKVKLEKGSRDFRRSLGECLAALDERYPGVIPDAAKIVEDDDYLGRAVRDVHKPRRVMSYFYPTGRDLVPIVLLLGMATVFNSDTLLMLNWDDVDENVDRAGSPAIKIIGRKPRAGKDQVRFLDASEFASNQPTTKDLLHLLRDITSRIRPHVVDPGHKDRLFIFLQQNAVKQPKSFGRTDAYNASGDDVWRRALRNFCDDNQIPRFILSQLRPTLIDMTLFLNGDLAAAAALGNHRNPHTTWTHYTSSGVKRRFTERLGEVLVLRQRWIESKGKIDPRRLTPKLDRGAATPGFLCLDPFDSPRPNQQKGRACGAYGECPACPLAAANLNDPIAAAHFMALKRTIYSSQIAMSTQTWVSRWAPILADLLALLNLLSDDVAQRAAEIHINLPPVG